MSQADGAWLSDREAGAWLPCVPDVLTETVPQGPSI